MGETDFKEKVQPSHYTSKQQTLEVGKQSPELLHYLNCPIKKKKNVYERGTETGKCDPDTGKRTDIRHLGKGELSCFTQQENEIRNQ